MTDDELADIIERVVKNAVTNGNVPPTWKATDAGT